ncbi:MAG: adenosylcobinamide-GDP ribazoletransferase [Anderseniella sp.]
MVVRHARELQLAFMLLTRLPVGKGGKKEIPLGSAAWAYPLAGLAVGCTGAATLAIAAGSIGLPPVIAAILAIAAMTIATGGLHEDGLADTADGFGGGGTKQRKLEIMQDSRIGSYGVMALIIVTSLRISALASLPLMLGCLGIVAVAVAARSFLPLIMRMQDSARPTGLGASASDVNLVPALVSVAFSVLALGLLLPFTHALLAGAIVLLVAIGVSLLAKRQIGGFTGDTLGATVQLGEAAALTSLLVL